ncbi:MAG: M48 family metallopeptidase [Gemmatimonadota bacterium]|nr:M48 family metallopeptidase [Gemmatimonadota bacterium]
MTTSVPAPRLRTAFPQIDAVSWEHPADRAALQALRAVPGFDTVVRKVIAFLGGERGIRLLFQGNAVRCGPQQFARCHQIHVEVCSTFDWPTIPELYVSQTPVFNAGAYGVDDPFIVLHSAAVELLDDAELRVLIAHEMGHVVSGHSLYRTIAEILLNVSLGTLPFLAGIALLPIKLAVLEWSRKSELSSDRAGLLGSQDVLGSQQLFMKMAGAYPGALESGQMSLDPFMAQAAEYAGSHEGFDIVYKILNTLALTHPMHTVRAAELQKWIAAGDYDRILRGEYVHRGAEAKSRPLGQEFSAAKDHYASEFREAASSVANAARQAAERARNAFRDAQAK